MPTHRRHINPRSVFCALTSRSPDTWNPTGPDPGPESRPFEIGNPVHFDYARERAQLESFRARLVDGTVEHVAKWKERSSNSWNSRTLIRKTGLDRARLYEQSLWAHWYLWYFHKFNHRFEDKKTITNKILENRKISSFLDVNVLKIVI